VNGQTRNGTDLGVPVLGDWRPVRIGGVAQPEPAPAPVAPEPGPVFPDPVADAEAAAIRARAHAETEAARIRAEAEADAIRITAEQKAERERIANERAAMRLEKERADHELRLAETRRKQEDIERQRAEAAAAQQAQRDAKANHAKEITTADTKWRAYAIRFAFVCGIVSLPVQMSFFWNPKAPWMAAAPIMLEGAAWVVHRGARAAVANRRPVWHYRLIVWLLAFVAAGINLYHGLHAFDLGTSLAPGVWDLHEHGRIRSRDGKQTRTERRRQRAEAKRLAAQKAAADKRADAERKAAEQAAREAAEKLAAERAAGYEKEWAHALLLAAALGETTVTETVWARAWYDIHGTQPGDTVDTIRTRRTAERRVEMARGETPANTPSKVMSAQRAIQVKTPRARSSYQPTPPRRTKGDTAPFHPVARALAADAKRKSNTVSAAVNGRRKDA
jgi:hypothetical protein